MGAMSPSSPERRFVAIVENASKKSRCQCPLLSPAKVPVLSRNSMPVKVPRSLLGVNSEKWTPKEEKRREKGKE